MSEQNNAAEDCVAAACAGDAEAQFRLGVMYCIGSQMPRDLGEAVNWYRRAADQGHRMAQYNIAVMLLNGDGVRQDDRAAFEWSRKAALQGMPEAQALLGNLYSLGRGTAADPDAAWRWHQKAAAQGLTTAAEGTKTLTPPPDPMPVEKFSPKHGGAAAIMTMVYNERVNLPIWIAHYRKMAPAAELFVIDHSSDDGSTDNLPGICKIPIPRGPLDEGDRAVLINSFQRGFLRYYDTVIYTDCDELIFPNPQTARTLEEHLKNRTYLYAAPVGVNVIHIIDEEPPLDFTRPLLHQRRFGQFHSGMCKPLIARTPLEWQPGFHTCSRPINIDRDLYLFHIKQIDRDEALRRQHLLKQVRWSETAIAARHSAHHRYEDERFIREFFSEPAACLRRDGARAFAFDSEIARVENEAIRNSGIMHVPAFRGPIVEIPEGFRDVF